MLTAFDLDEYVYAALRAGASGFLYKDTPPEHLINAINTVARGDMLFDRKITRPLIEAYTQRHTSQEPPPGERPNGRRP